MKWICFLVLFIFFLVGCAGMVVSMRMLSWIGTLTCLISLIFMATTAIGLCIWREIYYGKPIGRGR